ncbi:MAG TPA: protein-L-isoaspartate(D-aspartate) O-methyltransferase [Longimicrobiales bacterium]|nr:protein-L-isoaspartate(D-aspartate) O-methyltransferase [Longimicrobiales bacterium]
MTDHERERRALVSHLRRAGIHDEAVLEAMGAVPREAFVPPELEEFAYADAPLPIGEGQTISQPFVVAYMAQEARLRPEDRVLEVGTGSGYAAAVYSRLVAEVYTVERLRRLATLAQVRLQELGYDNVHVRWGDGTRGWPEAAPFDAILVAAGGPELPPSLREQLAPGGRVIIPVGDSPRDQRLVRLEREGRRFVRTDLGGVRFVPLLGREGWNPGPGSGEEAEEHEIVRLVREAAEPVGDIAAADLGALLARLAGARVVLLGEATHGTSEFYRMRARITRDLIENHGFAHVAIEGDWPDAAQVDRWVRGVSPDGRPPAFARFPTWMWRNRETADFVGWLRTWNESLPLERRVGFHGLDLYGMHASVAEVLAYLDEIDPRAAWVARERYGCLTPWERDPSVYGRAAVTGRYRLCEDEVVAMLQDLLDRRLEHVRADGERYLDAVQSARLIAGAERYYRALYRGGREAWNLRDRHMLETLRALVSWGGAGTRAVVWAHNSHVGDAEATEMALQGQETLGGLCRAWLADDVRLVGFGTARGSVAAASHWGGPVEVKHLREPRPGSYEDLCDKAELPAFVLELRSPSRAGVREALAPARLERAIGVVYRPETELESHHFHASLPHQFDAWIWFGETRAVEPLSPVPAAPGMPETFPFGV